MSVSRRLARAGLGLLALTAAALAVALVSDPHLVSRWFAGKHDARSQHGASQPSSQSTGSSHAVLGTPPLPLAAGDAVGPADRSVANGGAGFWASIGGLIPGTYPVLEAMADDDAEAGGYAPGGDETGGHGLRMHGRSLTFAAVSTHRLGGSGADEIDLPNEPTSAGAPSMAFGSAGGWADMLGNAAVGSFAFTTVATSAEGRTAQLPSRSSELTVGTVVLASAVPEPESAAMLLAGLFVLGAVARRRAQR